MQGFNPQEGVVVVRPAERFDFSVHKQFGAAYRDHDPCRSRARGPIRRMR